MRRGTLGSIPITGVAHWLILSLIFNQRRDALLYILYLFYVRSPKVKELCVPGLWLFYINGCPFEMIGSEIKSHSIYHRPVLTVNCCTHTWMWETHCSSLFPPPMPPAPDGDVLMFLDSIQCHAALSWKIKRACLWNNGRMDSEVVIGLISQLQGPWLMPAGRYYVTKKNIDYTHVGGNAQNSRRVTSCLHLKLLWEHIFYKRKSIRGNLLLVICELYWVAVVQCQHICASIRCTSNCVRLSAQRVEPECRHRPHAALTPKEFCCWNCFAWVDLTKSRRTLVANDAKSCTSFAKVVNF